MQATGRAWLFWLVCLPIRVGLAVGALLLARLKPAGLPFLGAALLLPAAGFAVQALLGGFRSRGGFGGPVWWADARAAHAAVYFAAAVLCFWEGKAAALVLLADAALAAALAIALQP